MPVIFASPEDEYKKHKELKNDVVKALMDWNKKQAHLPILSGEYDLNVLLNKIKVFTLQNIK